MNLFLWKRKRLQMKVLVNEAKEGLNLKKERASDRGNIASQAEKLEPNRTLLTLKG